MGLQSISVGSDEIVERVEDMTAWLAIASEKTNTLRKDMVFQMEHFYAAEPIISLGDGDIGWLRPNSVDAITPDTITTEEPKVDIVPEAFTKYVGDMLSNRGDAPFGYGSAMMECVPGDKVLGLAFTGDMVRPSDLRSGSVNDPVHIISNAKWQLMSVGVLPKSGAGWYKKKYNLPVLAPIVIAQSVTILEDGRALCGAVPYWWTGRLMDVTTKKPAFHGKRSTFLHSLAPAVINYAKRQDNWTVELALSENRTGVGLPTDAHGAKEFLNTLSKAGDSNSSRRKALVHWVSGHMRQSRSGGDPHFVRDHLRGKQTFKINSTTFVRIYPSRTDISKACNGARFANNPPTK